MTVTWGSTTSTYVKKVFSHLRKCEDGRSQGQQELDPGLNLQSCTVVADASCKNVVKRVDYGLYPKYFLVV